MFSTRLSTRFSTRFSSVSPSAHSPSRRRSGVALALTAALTFGVVACGSDDDEPTDTVVDELDSDGNTPFDNDVPPGVGTETDEGNNQGFDTDDGGPIGNQTDPNG